MAVYIDDMYTISLGSFRNMKMSHMIADTKKELLDMCRKIGVNIKWIQKENTYSEHFDICLSKRTKAVKAGAIEITMRQYATKVQERKFGTIVSST